MKELKAFGWIVSVALVAASGLAFVRRQEILDWWVLRDYVPSAEIASITNDTTMTSLGRTIFYVHDPKIETKEAFNRDCTIGESSIVLGCYDGKGIYVYRVADERLEGIKQVTAAHEMLHAAYERLTVVERKKIDTLTEQALQKVTNERIQNLVKSYRSRSQSSVPNELHSIIGTEIENLDPELEAYYARYFSDRKKIVTFSQKYEQVFTDLKAQVERFDAELSLMKSQIESQETSLNDRNLDLKSKKRQLDQYLASNSVSTYNAAVPGYNAAVQDYNQTIEEYKTLIADYNSKVAQRNELTVEQNDLIKSIDSKAESL